MLSIDIPARQHKIYMGGRFIYGRQILVQNLEVESSHSKTGVKRYLFEVGGPSTRLSAARLQEDAVKLGLDPPDLLLQGRSQPWIQLPDVKKLSAPSSFPHAIPKFTLWGCHCNIPPENLLLTSV